MDKHTTVSRTVREIRTAHASRDGDGVAIQRISGMRHAGMDPVLLIDELRSEHREEFAGGFPPHPHRGMQTLTYMKHGGLIHEDNRGHRGEIRGGGAQWMSAGRGIVHSEMPTKDSKGLHGFQLWVNLPAAEKMSEPQYRDVPAEALGQVDTETAVVRAVAGDWNLRGIEGEDVSVSGPLEQLARRADILDVQLVGSAQLVLASQPDENLLVYVYDGNAHIGDAGVNAQQLAITQPGDQLVLESGIEGLSALVLRGSPLREPVANYGPFVMNTAAEIEQAIADYRDGSFG